MEDKPLIEAAEIARALTSNPDTLPQVLAHLPPATKKTLGLQWAMAELESEFAKADKDKDGALSYKEFYSWAHELIEVGKPTESEVPPTAVQLRACFVVNMVPYVGFGLVDNTLMICSGEAIDGTLGLLLGLSTLGAAALGNAFSNATGMMLHGTIERSASALGLPNPRLTIHQRSLPIVANVRMAAGVIGVLFGCILGMFPLLFMDKSRSQGQRELQRSHSKAAA